MAASFAAGIFPATLPRRHVRLFLAGSHRKPHSTSPGANPLEPLSQRRGPEGTAYQGVSYTSRLGRRPGTPLPRPRRCPALAAGGKIFILGRFIRPLASRQAHPSRSCTEHGYAYSPRGSKQERSQAQPNDLQVPALARDIIVDRVVCDHLDFQILPKQAGKEPLDWDIHNLTLTSAGQNLPLAYHADLTNAKPKGDCLPWHSAAHRSVVTAAAPRKRPHADQQYS